MWKKIKSTRMEEMSVDKIHKFIIDSNKIHNNFYNYSKCEYKNNKTPLEIGCPLHGYFWQRPDAHIHQKQGCPRCSKINNLEDFIEKSNKIHNNFYDYSRSIFINSKMKTEISCPTHGCFWQRPNDHLNGIGCPKCNKSNKLTKEDFENRSNIVHDFYYNYSKSDFKNTTTKIEICCPEHGYFTQSPIYHMTGSRCQKCSKTNDLEIFIFKSNKIHNNFHDYSKCKYLNNVTKIEIGCPLHGYFWQSPRKHLIGQGCPVCNKSFGEKKIEQILKNYKINYIPQYKFADCKHIGFLLFDFYLPDSNCCIEFDGKQHFFPVEWWGGDKKLEIIKIRDKIKNDFCKENDIKLLRIKYTENVDKIMFNFLETIV